jgi:hypothetical protein
VRISGPLESDWKILKQFPYYETRKQWSTALKKEVVNQLLKKLNQNEKTNF